MPARLILSETTADYTRGFVALACKNHMRYIICAEFSGLADARPFIV
jgi:hypothetical protein